MYGEPSHIRAVRYRDLMAEQARPGETPQLVVTYNFDVIYLSKGLYLRGFDSSKPILSSDTRLTLPVFFVPTIEGYADVVGDQRDVKRFLVSWHGFDDFDFYCREPVTADPCTPSE